MPVALEIVSPEKLLLSRPVDMVVIPGSEGDMGVLEGHTPMIVMLRGGVIALYEGEQITDRLFVAGGFAEVTPERCTVLANEAMPVAEVSRAEGERRLAEAEAAYGTIEPGDTAAEDAALDRIQSARAMVEATEGVGMITVPDLEQEGSAGVRSRRQSCADDRRSSVPVSPRPPESITGWHK